MQSKGLSSHGSLEARPQSEGGKLESGASAPAPAEAGPEKDGGSLSQTPGTPPGPTTTSREVNKICFPTYSQGEKKSLQIKEFIWCLEDWATPETVRGKDPRRPWRGTDRILPASDSLTSKALLVLPPLKSSPPDGLDVLGKKTKNFFLRPEEKGLSVPDLLYPSHPIQFYMIDLAVLLKQSLVILITSLEPLDDTQNQVLTLQHGVKDPCAASPVLYPDIFTTQICMGFP